jgi:8-oxo-dGTP pyrophosphatase MutT (NUDIX family)
MLLKEATYSFKPIFDVVSCYVEHRGRIVVLHRNNEKSQGDRWGVPAGKRKEGEDLRDAMTREIKEETGISVDRSKLQYFKTVFVRHGGYDFVYHMFSISLEKMMAIRINFKEHKDYRWVSPFDALKMPLVGDLDECIRMFYFAQEDWN